jgi:hypothetical protein
VGISQNKELRMGLVVECKPHILGIATNTWALPNIMYGPNLIISLNKCRTRGDRSRKDLMSMI